MIILTIRTDNPEAELGLYEDTQQLEHVVWHAHRQLAETLHKQIEHVLHKHGKSLHDVGGIACYEGPGSFTGLRIGLTVANTLAYGLAVPIVASGGDGWQKVAIKKLLAGGTDTMALPEYGADVHITLPKQPPK